MSASDLELLVNGDRELVKRRGLEAFVRIAWPEVEPTQKLVWGRHLDEMIVHATLIAPNWRDEPTEEQVKAREPGSWAKPLIREFVCNQPPGTTKSMFWSILWPAWVWTWRPEYRWIWAAYDPKLALLHAEKVFKLVRSQWFVQRWGDILEPGPAAMGMFETKAGGFRFSTSVGGGMTGRHAHFLGVDDPVKPADADSTAKSISAALDNSNYWWDSTTASRALDKEQFVRACIMQAIHENDLSQKMKRAGAIHLCIPALFEPPGFVTPFGKDWRTEAGEAINPAPSGRLSKAAFQEDAERMAGFKGPGAWESPVAVAQLQQRPAPPGGLIFKDSTFKPFDSTILKRRRMRVALSVDCNFKKADTASDVGIAAVGECDLNLHVLEAASERGGLVETIALIEHYEKKLKPEVILIEDKANGPAVIEILRRKFRNVIALDPKTSKESRAHAGNVYYQAGSVFHDVNMPGLKLLEASLKSFPRGMKKDLVDALMQALIYLAAKDHTAFARMVEAMDQEAKRSGIFDQLFRIS